MPEPEKRVRRTRRKSENKNDPHGIDTVETMSSIPDPYRFLGGVPKFGITYVQAPDLDERVQKAGKSKESDIRKICLEWVQSTAGGIGQDSFLLICGNFTSSPDRYKFFMEELSFSFDPKRVVIVPSAGGIDMQTARKIAEEQHMAFLDGQMMILKENSRFVYEASDVIAAARDDIKEELEGSQLAIIGGPGDSLKGLHEHVRINSPTASIIIFTDRYPGKDYNVNWTYVCREVESDPGIGYRVFSDCGSEPMRFEIRAGHDASICLREGTKIYTPDEYRSLMAGMGMPIIYKADKDVTTITKGGCSMYLMQPRMFVSTVLDKGLPFKLDHATDYFERNMETYAEAAYNTVLPYYLRMKDIALNVRRIGGRGEIDGCSIEIDDEYKLFVDPNDFGLVLYQPIPHGIIYHDEFTGYLNRISSDPEIASKLTLKKVAADPPAYMSRKSLRRMSPIADCLMSVVEHSMIRRWNDLMLEPGTTLVDMIMSNTEEE